MSRPNILRVALASPLPPEPSGVADSCAELLPALGERLAIELFTADPRLARIALRDRFPVYPYRALRRRAGDYDALVYQVGNNAAAHGPIYELMLELPGVAVLHEFLLHHLVRRQALRRGGDAALAEEMRYAYGTAGERAARGVAAPDPWTWPLFERAVDRSRGVIVHSETARRRILASRPLARVAVAPLPVALAGAAGAASEQRRDLRRRLGFADGEVVLGSFGLITPPKRPEVVLRAFARLRASRPQARCLMVGEVPPGYPEVEALLAGPLAKGVTVTGRVPLADLVATMSAVDVAVNLRHPSGGETSAACVRLLGLGTPVVVTGDGWFSEIPDGCCAKVPPGPEEEEVLSAMLDALAADPELRRGMGASAARWAREHHDIGRAADAYATFIAEIAAARPEPTPVVPPLARPAPGDAAALLMAELAAAAADLGAREDDQVLLPVLAETAVELGLDPLHMRTRDRGRTPPSALDRPSA